MVYGWGMVSAVQYGMVWGRAWLRVGEWVRVGHGFSHAEKVFFERGLQPLRARVRAPKRAPSADSLR